MPNQLKAYSFIATSLDGFIAREDGGIDWLPTYGDEDYGYEEFFSSIDALVLGRNSYELILGFETWPYGDKPVVVLSSRPDQIPRPDGGRVHTSGGRVEEVVRDLTDSGYERVYVDGGKTIQAFIRSKALHAITISRIPVLLGSGIPLFGELEADVNLVHEATRSFPDGLVQSRYRFDYDRA